MMANCPEIFKGEKKQVKRQKNCLKLPRILSSINYFSLLERLALQNLRLIVEWYSWLFLHPIFPKLELDGSVFASLHCQQKELTKI